MCHLRAQNGSFALNKIYLVKTLILLSSTYWPFSLSKIFKKFLQWIQSFWPQNGPFATKTFFGKKKLWWQMDHFGANLRSQFRENLRKDGRTDGRTDPTS